MQRVVDSTAVAFTEVVYVDVTSAELLDVVATCLVCRVDDDLGFYSSVSSSVCPATAHVKNMKNTHTHTHTPEAGVFHLLSSSRSACRLSTDCVG